MLSFLCCLGKKRQWKTAQNDEDEDVHETKKQKQPELTPDDIVAALQSRGWEASIVSSKDLGSLLVETKSSGILKCVDGRGAFVIVCLLHNNLQRHSSFVIQTSSLTIFYRYSIQN